MELPSLLVVNQSKRELTGISIEALDAAGGVLPEGAGTLDARVRVLSGRGPGQLVPLRGDARTGRGRVRLEFGPDCRISFLTDGRPRTDGVVETEHHSGPRLRILRSVAPGRTVFTVHEAAAMDSWMSALSDDARLSGLTIPGTHDTCAREYGGDLAICQTLTLQQQLDAGVRFIDIRCRHIDDVFTIHHGVVYEHLTFGTGVRDVCLNFLASHPTETIVMSVKEEYDPSGNTRTFEQTFEWYLEGNRNRWYLDVTVPRLGDVRGRIVLFRRFSAEVTPMGIEARPWQDDATFEINNAARMKVQDQYKVATICDIKKKWDKVKGLLDEAREGTDPDRWYVNFCSGTSTGAYPYTVAKGSPGYEGVNEHLKSYLESASRARTGTVLMDFPEYPDNVLIGLLAAQN